MKNDWKNKYKKMLYDIDISMEDISVYVGKNMPKYLYKYRSFNKYWEDIIYNALSLNNPFDCHMYVDVKRFCDFMNSFAHKYIFVNNSVNEIKKYMIKE